MSVILGIHDAHGASAALMIDGKIVAAAQEERWTGIKEDYGYPRNAVNYCLKFAGIKTKDIDRVILNGLSWNPVLTYFKRNANFAPEDWVREQREYFKYVLGIKEAYTFEEIQLVMSQEKNRGWAYKGVEYFPIFKDIAKAKGWTLDKTYDMRGLLKYVREGDRDELPFIRRQTVSIELGNFPLEKIQTTEHENTHITYAYFASLLRERAIVLTAEGCGDYSNSTVSVIEPEEIPKKGDFPRIGRKLIQYSNNFDNHIGHIYQYITLLLGMRPARDEYKVMGLAPYADPKRADECFNLLQGILKVDGLKICVDKMPSDFYFRFRRIFEGHRFDDIAGGLQLWTEDLLSRWVYNCVKELKCGNVVFAGGVAQNIKAVQAMSEMPGVKSLYVMPAAGDTSSSIGACYYAGWKAGETLEPLMDVYLGPEPDEDWFANEIIGKGYTFYNMKSYPCLPPSIAELLANGLIIARCSGRMEFGLRALGNRSIMADPRNLMTVNRINKAIKKRDFWMPFTPSILDTDMHRYVVNPKNLDARFMTQAFESTPLAREHLPAALHPGDWTVRPQVVYRNVNPEYYDIISEFKKRTGVGAILNTSFNLSGEPIVLGEKEALRTFENSDLDGLIVGKWLALKNPLKN